MQKLWTPSFHCRKVLTHFFHVWPSRPLSNRGQRDSTGQKTFSAMIKPQVLGSKSDNRKKEMLSRTTVVTDENVSSKIVGSIMRLGEPVAVDMEGVQQPVLGLIQVKTVENEIFIFRTGRNQKLFVEGKLKNLFEDQNILKVMHSSFGDCNAIYKEGIKMWGLYDTALAHKVIQFQKEGVSTLGGLTGFNAVCEAYGFTENPLKDWMAGTSWQRTNLFAEAEELPEDLVYYAASDVEPLLDIYHMTSSLIDTDFLPLFHDLCEIELIRCVDPDLAKLRRNLLKRYEQHTIVVTNVDNIASKAPFYEILANQPGSKKVLSAVDSRSVHILMQNRQNAILAHNALNDRQLLNRKIGKKAQVRLLVPVQTDEVEAAELVAEKSRDRLKGEDYIVDADKAAKLTELLQRVQCPVVVEAASNNNDVATVELFVGKFPSFKFDVNPETIVTFGLGKLFSSKDVPKIVGRIDSPSLSIIFRTLASRDFRPTHFFDIASAFKVFEFLMYGNSIFKAATPTPKEMAQRIGIFTPSHLERFLYSYLHLKNYLPVDLIKFLDAKSRIEVDLSSNVFVAEAKEARKQLRLKYETHAVHIIAKPSQSQSLSSVRYKSRPSLGPFLRTFLKDRNLEFNFVIAFGDRAVVSLTYHPDVQELIQELNSSGELPNFQLSASKVDITTAIRDQPSPVNLLGLDRKNLPNLENLDQLGFFSIANDDHAFAVVPDVSETSKRPRQTKKRKSSLVKDSYKDR